MFPKQNCPVCQNRAYYDTNGALTLMSQLQEAMKSEARLLEENEKLVNEITKLKEKLTVVYPFLIV